MLLAIGDDNSTGGLFAAELATELATRCGVALVDEDDEDAAFNAWLPIVSLGIVGLMPRGSPVDLAGAMASFGVEIDANMGICNVTADDDLVDGDDGDQSATGNDVVELTDGNVR